MNGEIPFGTVEIVGEQDMMLIEIVVEEDAVPLKEVSRVKVPVTCIVTDNVKLPY